MVGFYRNGASTSQPRDLTFHKYGKWVWFQAYQDLRKICRGEWAAEWEEGRDEAGEVLENGCEEGEVLSWSDCSRAVDLLEKEQGQVAWPRVTHEIG